MELVANFVKDAFFLLLLVRIAMIVVLMVIIYKAMMTPLISDLFRKPRGYSKRSNSWEKNSSF